MTIVDEAHSDVLATVCGLFLHPDRGTVEGFFVQMNREEAFLAVSDITHWGRTIVVRDADMLSPLDERVRLSALYKEGRPVMGQSIMTEDGRTLGACADVQFETETFRLEWIFPRRWFRWKTPIPASSILEVRSDAVIVRTSALSVEQPAPERVALNPLEVIGPSIMEVQ